MKRIIQKCKRCQVQIPAHAINKSEGIYKCTACNTVASAYDENEYKPSYDFPLLDGMSIEELSNSVKLRISQPKFMSPDISVRGCLPWVAIIAPLLFFTGCDFTINGSAFYGHKIVGIIFLVFIVKLYFDRIKRPITIEITPYTLAVYQENRSSRSQRHLFDSYMIDQVSVTEMKHPTGSTSVYGLQIFTKDGKMHDLFPTFSKVKPELQCIEKFIEDALNITDRKVSGEAQ